jgi:UDP-glucuronate 4-epimerase
MALYRFVEAILRGRPIDVYGEGRMKRDFTFIDDLVEAVVRLIAIPPAEENRIVAPASLDTLSPTAPYRVVNIGRGQPVGLEEFIGIVEEAVGRPAIRNPLPMQPGDVPQTYASPALLETLTGYRPCTSVSEGVRAFVDWYRDYHATGDTGAGKPAVGSLSGPHAV